MMWVEEKEVEGNFWSKGCLKQNDDGDKTQKERVRSEGARGEGKGKNRWL